jgi:hypothetical protein
MFSVGIVQISGAMFAMMALVMLVAMAFALPPSADVASSELFRRLGWVCAILAILLVIIALMTSSTMYWFRLLTFGSHGDLASPLLFPVKVTHYANMLKPFVCVAFCGVVAAMTILSRREVSGSTSSGNDSGGGPITRLPPPSPMNAGGAAFGKRERHTASVAGGLVMSRTSAIDGYGGRSISAGLATNPDREVEVRVVDDFNSELRQRGFVD